MWFLIKMCICLGVAAYFVPSDFTASLRASKMELPCQSLEGCKAKAESSLLSAGVSSILEMFETAPMPHKAKLSNGQNTQNTLKSYDLDVPWQGPDGRKRKKLS